MSEDKSPIEPSTEFTCVIQKPILEEFIGRRLEDLTKMPTQLRDMEQKLRDDQFALYAARVKFKAMYDSMLLVKKENPELFNPSALRLLKELNYHFDYWNRPENNSPIDALLSWSRDEAKGPFFTSELFALIGKEDSRYVIELLRRVIALADITKAGEL